MSNLALDAFPAVGLVGYLIGGVVGLVGVGYFVWVHAPTVGGEWWPYVRAVTTLIAAIVGAKAFALVGAVLFGLLTLAIGVIGAWNR